MTPTKSIAVAAVAAFTLSSAASAGGLAPEIVEMEEIQIVEDTRAGTSGNLIIPLILIALIAVAMSSTSGGNMERM